MIMRAALIEMAAAVKARNLKWVLESDWPFLEAARVYETPAVMANTGGINIMRYLKETMGVAIDPLSPVSVATRHSHGRCNA